MNKPNIIGARLYIKPNVIGLEFSDPKARDNFWTLLGENRDAASLFGKRSVRLHPDKAQRLFHVPLFTDKIAVIEPEPPVQPKAVEVPVSVTTLKAQEPMPAIGKLPPEVTGELIPAPQQTIAEVLEVMQPPAQVQIPQVASVLKFDTVQSAEQAKEDIQKVVDPKPVGVHHMSKEMREWRARNNK